MRNTISHKLFSSEVSSEIYSDVIGASQVSRSSRVTTASEFKSGIAKKASRPAEVSLSRWLRPPRDTERTDDKFVFDKKEFPDFANSFDPTQTTRNNSSLCHRIYSHGIDSNATVQTQESRNPLLTIQSCPSVNHKSSQKINEEVSLREISICKPFSKKIQQEEVKCADTSLNEEDFKLVSRSTTTQNKQESQTSLNSISPTPSPTKIQQRFTFLLPQLAHTGKRDDSPVDHRFIPLPVCRLRRLAGMASSVPQSSESHLSSLLAQTTFSPVDSRSAGGSECKTAFFNGKYKVFYRHLKRLSTNSQQRCNRMLAGQDLILRSECRESIDIRTTQNAHFIDKLAQLISVCEIKK